MNHPTDNTHKKKNIRGYVSIHDENDCQLDRNEYHDLKERKRIIAAYKRMYRDNGIYLHIKPGIDTRILATPPKPAKVRKRKSKSIYTPGQKVPKKYW